MAKNKQCPQEEIRELYYDALDFDVFLKPPCFLNMSEDFVIEKEGIIRFGFSHIKGIGGSGIKQLNKIKERESWGKILFELIKVGVKKTVVEGCVKCGSFDYLDISRTKMLYEFELLSAMSAAQKKIFLEKFDSAENPQQKMEQIIAENKRLKMPKEAVEIIEKNKDKKFVDHCLTKDIWESTYLGINLTSSRIEEYMAKYDVSHDCASVNKTKSGNVCFVGVLDAVKKIKTKKDGKEMAFISISDLSGRVDDIVVFNELFIDSYHNKCILQKPEDEVLKITGFKQKDKDSVICQGIEILN
jgi:DNA polymerase III alpha subunit